MSSPPREWIIHLSISVHGSSPRQQSRWVFRKTPLICPRAFGYVIVSPVRVCVTRLLRLSGPWVVGAVAVAVACALRGVSRGARVGTPGNAHSYSRVQGCLAVFPTHLYRMVYNSAHFAL